MGAARLTAAAFLAVVVSACSSSAPVAVTAIDGAAYEPSVAIFRDGFTVAWYDTRDGYGEIYEQALDAEGQMRGPEVRLTSAAFDAYEADVHATEGTVYGDGFVIGWYEKHAAGAFTPHLGFWSRGGALRWTRTLAPRGRNTVVRLRGEFVFAAWVEDEVAPAAGVWTGWWNLRGDSVVAPRRIADAGKTTYNLNAALRAPEAAHHVPMALVAFDALPGNRAEEIYLAEDDGTSAHVVRLTPDDGHASKYPDLVLSGSRAALTWFDAKDGNEEVYLRVAALPDLARADALTGTRVTSTDGHSIGAYTAWNGDRLGLAWCDDTPGQHEIYFAEFGADGAARGEPRRLTETKAGSLIPSIHAWRSGFVLAWNEYEGASGHDEDGRSQVLLTVVP